MRVADAVARPLDPAERRACAGGALLAMALAGLVLLGTATVLADSRGDVDTLAYGDGLIYRYVAGHLTTPPDEIHPVVSERGTSLRYGRIGLPVLIWAGAGGNNSAMPYTHVALILLAAAATGAATVALLPRRRPLLAALAFLAPGVPLAISGGFAEIVAIAFALWAVRFALLDRWMPAAAAMAAALLTRENAGAVLLALLVWALTRQQPRGFMILSASLLPLTAWYGVVWARFGHIPVFDPYLRSFTDTLGLPIGAMLDSLSNSTAARGILILHIAAGITALFLARRNLYGVIAAACALQILISGPFAWTFVGEAMRTPVFLQLFLVLAVAHERLRRTTVSPAAPDP